MIHAKKVEPEYFAAALRGDKTFELRQEEDGEPGFAVGDYLALNECESGRHSDGPHYSGRCLLYRITYVLRDYPLLAPGAVALGLRLMPLSGDDLDALKTERLLPRWQ